MQNSNILKENLNVDRYHDLKEMLKKLTKSEIMDQYLPYPYPYKSVTKNEMIAMIITNMERMRWEARKKKKTIRVTHQVDTDKIISIARRKGDNDE